MSNQTRPPLFLFGMTIGIFLLCFVGILYFSQSKLPPAISLNTKDQPTIGYAKTPVNVVIFDEPKCVNCKDFHLTIFPKLKEEFIDTNKITYTVIPVSFLPGSMPAATSLLCVYYCDPKYPNDELFFTYLNYIYEHQPDEHTDWATKEHLIEFAKAASPAIPLERFDSCLSVEAYRAKIESNTHYGQKIMGGELSTPTLYVNGIAVQELTYDEVSKLIKQVLQEEGVH